MRVHICLLPMLCAGTLAGGTLVQRQHSDETTRIAREIILERIAAIGSNGHCRQTFGRERIDLDLLRRIVQQTTFYNATGLEGDLKFSVIVGQPASPDRTIRVLAREVEADAFVLGYFVANRYIRTRHVVLARGYYEQADSMEGSLRPTTLEEKESLLLHEILHIALDKDDDDLNSRALCPLRLLSFCPRSQSADGPIEGSPSE